MSKKMIGVEIVPGAIVHMAKNTSRETIKALRTLAYTVQNLPDEELEEIKLYADYLKSKKKKKVGRPRKEKYAYYHHSIF